ncbi:hypothetical protein ACFL3I_05310 [Pseudomonadota bacterium]
MNTQARFATTILLIGFLLVSPLSLAAEDTKPPKLFDDTSVMKVTLTGPWKRLEKNVKDDVLYPVKLSYTGADGQQQVLDAEVAPRGITRRLRVCKFPPLKIHFNKDKTKGTEFRGNKSLKLVTYCQTHSKYEQYYVKEFLVYRIYNLLTDLSFRVKPMVIEYKDSEDDDSSITRFSFLIEDIDDVAKRNDLKELSIATTPYKELDPAITSKLSIFQFMIGNLDWAATGGPKADSCCHNSRLIGVSNEVFPRYGVPYDFDSSGLVNAHYASPPDSLKVRNIRQRLYRGFCAFNGELPQTAVLFNEKKAEILALFENNSFLNDRTRQVAISYIEGFYKILNDPKRFKRDITDKCRGQG